MFLVYGTGSGGAMRKKRRAGSEWWDVVCPVCGVARGVRIGKRDMRCSLCGSKIIKRAPILKARPYDYQRLLGYSG